MPRVSVIIPTHSRPHLLPRAVESVFGAGEDVEVIVVDDASADETAEVCKSLRGIKYIRLDRNQGVAGARNLGLLASTCEYVSFLDDDDVRLQGTLDEQADILESAPRAGLVYGRALLGDQDCNPTGGYYPELCPRGDVFWELLEVNFIPCGSALFRKSSIYRVGLLDKDIAGVDDWDLWIRMAELYPVEATERPVFVWRQSTPGSGQGSSATIDLISLGVRLLRNRWLSLPRAEGAGGGARRRSWRGFSDNVSRYVIREAVASLLKGELGSARKASAVALRLHPLSLLKAVRSWASLPHLRVRASECLPTGGPPEAEARHKRAGSQGGGGATRVR